MEVPFHSIARLSLWLTMSTMHTTLLYQTQSTTSPKLHTATPKLYLIFHFLNNQSPILFTFKPLFMVYDQTMPLSHTFPRVFFSRLFLSSLHPSFFFLFVATAHFNFFFPLPTLLSLCLPPHLWHHLWYPYSHLFPLAHTFLHQTSFWDSVWTIVQPLSPLPSITPTTPLAKPTK